MFDSAVVMLNQKNNPRAVGFPLYDALRSFTSGSLRLLD